MKRFSSRMAAVDAAAVGSLAIGERVDVMGELFDVVRAAGSIVLQRATVVSENDYAASHKMVASQFNRTYARGKHRGYVRK